MSITVAEKTHWKERIAQKIERAIKELVTTHDPLYLENASKRTHEAAIATLGGTELAAKLKSLENEKKRVSESMEATKTLLDKLAQDKPLQPHTNFYDTHWHRAVAYQQEVELNHLLANDTLGQRILKLRSEQESLLDTVWLSTSTVQIRELWQNVTELLADELSELQKKVLAAAPGKADSQ